MKLALKVLGGLGLVAIALFGWFSNPARAPKGQQSQATPRSSTQLVAQSESQMITDFTNADETQQWRSVDDVVMGGVSQSMFSVTPAGTGVFSGELSLENNGGFASVRRNVGEDDLEGARAIALRIKGDGRPYDLRLQTDKTNDGVSYRAEFETQADEWTEVRLPIADFEPVYRGRVVEDAPELGLVKIKQVGFLLADKQPGSFRLETDWIQIER